MGRSLQVIAPKRKGWLLTVREPSNGSLAMRVRVPLRSPTSATPLAHRYLLRAEANGLSCHTISSVVERLAHGKEVMGSIPISILPLARRAFVANFDGPQMLGDR